MKVIIFPEPREATLQDITLHLSEWLLSKRQKISVDEDVEKRETQCTIGGKVNRCCAVTVENSMEFPQKIKNRTTI